MAQMIKHFRDFFSCCFLCYKHVSFSSNKDLVRNVLFILFNQKKKNMSESHCILVETNGDIVLTQDQNLAHQATNNIDRKTELL